MSIFWLKRDGNNLCPAEQDSAAIVSKLPFNKLLRVEIKQPRNSRHSALYWVMCHRIADAVGADPENVSDLLKIETGHATLIRSKKYGEIRLPKSIAFANMGQQEFNQFFEACLLTIYENWGIERADVMASVNDLLEPRTEKRA